MSLFRRNVWVPGGSLPCVVLLLALGAPVSSADPRPETLNFAWPDGARADVTYTVDGWRKNGSSTTTLHRMQTYELQVREIATRGGAKLEIERVWPELTAPIEPGKSRSLFGREMKMGGGLGALQTLVDDLPEYVPILRVNAEGQLVSVGGLDEIEARPDKAFAESEAGPVERRQMASLTSEDALHTMSHQAWAGLVTIWNGLHLEDDFPIEDRSGADVPGQPMRVEVPGRGTFEGWVPCTDAETTTGGEERCVRLRWSASPQGADVEEAMEALEVRPVGDLRLTREITVVVDPATLLPYSTVDHLEASRVLPGNVEASEEITRTRRFDWTLP